MSYMGGGTVRGELSGGEMSGGGSVQGGNVLHPRHPTPFENFRKNVSTTYRVIAKIRLAARILQR